MACDQGIEETGSGVKARKRLDGLLAKLVDGDELIVSEIDRLGRTTADVILIMDELTGRGVMLKVLGMPSLYIRSDDGRLIADIVASLAAHERRRTRRRQAEGIAAAKAGAAFGGLFSSSAHPPDAGPLCGPESPAPRPEIHPCSLLVTRERSMPI